MNKTLLTDFYELTMGQTYFDNNELNKKVYFDCFFRKNPFKGGYTLKGGLEELINYILNFKFTKEDIIYLRSLNCFSDSYLDYLSNLKFTGDIWAILDGTPVFANEPNIIVRANIIEAQIIETALLTYFNHANLVLTKAKRITEPIKNIPVMEFGARRGPGDAGIEVSKYAYIGGCVGTSNTLAGMIYDIPVMGTMAHSMISSAKDEYTAFLNYAKSNPNNCVFLVDTYNTLESGIPNAIKVAQDYLIPNGYKFKGIRIDSGNLAELSKKARKMLDEAGFYETGICLSNGLNEKSIAKLKEDEAKFNSLGVGDNIACPLDIMGGVYKLVATEENGQIIPKIKISDDSLKTINPGFKKVYRLYSKDTHKIMADVVALYDEILPNDNLTLDINEFEKITLSNYEVKELLVPIFKDGKLVYKMPKAKEVRSYCDELFQTMPDELKRFDNPANYPVFLAPNLFKLKNEMLEEEKQVALTRRRG